VVPFGGITGMSFPHGPIPRPVFGPCPAGPVPSNFGIKILVKLLKYFSFWEMEINGFMDSNRFSFNESFRGFFYGRHDEPLKSGGRNFHELCSAFIIILFHIFQAERFQFIQTDINLFQARHGYPLRFKKCDLWIKTDISRTFWSGHGRA
jgi:hypothetical protein